MPYINIYYDIAYFDDNEKYRRDENVKKEVFFDIIGHLPSIPFPLPSISGMKKGDIEKIWDDENFYEKFTIPLSHPLQFLIGIPPYGIKKFSLPLYIQPRKSMGSDRNGDYYFLSWEIIRKEKNINNVICFNTIWEIDKYMKLWNYFFGNFHILPSDLEFLVHLLILDGHEILDEEKGFYDNEIGVFSPSRAQIYRAIFPELLHDSNVVLHFSQWFKKDEFPSFTIDYHTVKDRKRRHITNPLFHIQSFTIKNHNESSSFFIPHNKNNVNLYSLIPTKLKK